MAVTELASINNSVAASDEFTPTDDFYVVVDAGQIALAAKLPGTSKFYLCSAAGIDKVSAVIHQANTLVKVTPYITGTVYKIVPQSKRATATAYKE
jgi:hypothetical protein